MVRGRRADIFLWDADHEGAFAWSDDLAPAASGLAETLSTPPTEANGDTVPVQSVKEASSVSRRATPVQRLRDLVKSPMRDVMIHDPGARSHRAPLRLVLRPNGSCCQLIRRADPVSCLGAAVFCELLHPRERDAGDRQ